MIINSFVLFYVAGQSNYVGLVLKKLFLKLKNDIYQNL